MQVSLMTEAAPSVNFFILILDNGYSVQGSDQCKLECYNCQKKSILFFNKFHMTLICLFVPKTKKIVTKYVVCYSNNLCFKG